MSINEAVRQFAACVISAAAVLVSVTQVQAGNVSCNSPGQDLQRAIDNAEYGDTLVVHGFCNKGPYVVRKNLALTGDATLSSPDGGAVLSIVLADVTLDGIEVDASGADDGIVLQGASIEAGSLAVRNAGSTGLHVGLNSYARVIESEFTDNNIAIFVTESSSLISGQTRVRNSGQMGIFVIAASSALIVDAEILDGNIGVLADRLSNVSLFGSRIESNAAEGVWISDKYSYVSFRTEANTIQSNGVDIRCDARGYLEAEAPQTSSTKLTQIAPDCVFMGVLF